MGASVYLCRGSGCRKKLSEKELERALDRRTKIVPVRCQKVCSGAVVGTDVSGRVEWFSKMDSDKALSALGRAIEKVELTKLLEKRRSKKRSGKLRT